MDVFRMIEINDRMIYFARSQSEGVDYEIFSGLQLESVMSE